MQIMRGSRRGLEVDLLYNNIITYTITVSQLVGNHA